MVQHESATDLPEYYYAFGVLVALAYFFRLTDLHFENIVVSQNCPVVVDLELLAHVYGDDHRVDDTGLVGESPYSALSGGGILWSTSMSLAETTLLHHSGATLARYVPTNPLTVLVNWLNTRTIVHIHEQALRLTP